jgi:hypothetical protein
MSFGQNGTIAAGLKAAADLSAKQFFLVEITAADTVNVCNAAGDYPVGAIQNKPLAGEAVELAGCPGCVVKVKAGGVVAVGDWVGTDANGKAIAKTADKDFAVGRALEAGVDGRIIAVLWLPTFLGV